jgi:hypothetical protein
MPAPFAKVLANKVLDSKVVTTVAKNGTNVIISATTKGEGWTRADEIADKVGMDLAKAVQRPEVSLPTGTVQLTAR